MALEALSGVERAYIHVGQLPLLPSRANRTRFAVDSWMMSTILGMVTGLSRQQVYRDLLERLDVRVLTLLIIIGLSRFTGLYSFACAVCHLLAVTS